MCQFSFLAIKVFMFKKLFGLLLISSLSACSSVSWTSYIPFVGDSKPVLNLNKDEIDQKSYAVAYASTVQTYRGQVKKDYDVNSFASGVKDWYSNRILVPIEQIKGKLSQGIDSNVHAYYSGVVFAYDLQNNFSRLSSTCWSHIDRESMTQGVYDAMLDIRKEKIRSDEDDYIVKGSEMLLQHCQ